MIVPHENFRLNPARAIYITGQINDDLVMRLTPVIIKLQHLGRKPISVYIDSPGGAVSSMETILRLLKLSNQDSAPPCRVITAVTVNAGSAAADLLSSGDYAIAYASTNILYHGLRTYERNPLTLEYTSMLANSLRMGNDMYAMQLARKIEDRFTFRYLFARNEFESFREMENNRRLSDLDCFIEIIGSKLSREAKKVWMKAKDRFGRYEDLLDTVIKGDRRKIGARSLAQMEADHLKALIALELKNSRKDPTWTFSGGGISRLVDDFFLLTEYVENYGSERLKTWCSTFGRWLIAPETLRSIEANANEEARAEELLDTVRPILQPLWSFFVALCHALQDGENRLTATDAYWLGLVDEVIGEQFMSVRFFEEFQPDEPGRESAQPLS